jgi:broad specificity phosphatase PhoE
MGEVYFVRHGQASYGAANYDKLSPLGHRQAAWLGEYLGATIGGFDHMVCGSLQRHRETLDNMTRALPAAETLIDDRLNEMSYFAMERAFEVLSGQPVPQDADSMAQHFSAVMAAWEAGQLPGDLESYQSFQSRVVEAMLDHARHGARVLLVSSGGPKGIVMRHVLGLGSKEMTDVILNVFNSSYSRFSVRPDGIRLMQFNATGHLEGIGREDARTYL